MLKEILEKEENTMKIGLEDGTAVVKTVFGDGEKILNTIKISYNGKKCEYKTNSIDVFNVKGDCADILNALIQELYLNGNIKEV